MSEPAMWAVNWGRFPQRLLCALIRHQVVLYERTWECDRCGFRVILYPTPAKIAGQRVEFIYRDEPARIP